MTKPKTTKPAKKKGGDKLSWNPTTYAVAKQHVDLARAGTPPIGAALARMMPHAIQTMGGLTCPAPATDPGGIYRVGLDGKGLPEIQRQDATGGWQPVP
jgi:hypothetical protein